MKYIHHILLIVTVTIMGCHALCMQAAKKNPQAVSALLNRIGG